MFSFIERVMAASRKFTMVDYGFFKFLMITFGILLSVYLPMRNILWLIWLIFVISAVWMIYKIFKYTK